MNGISFILFILFGTCKNKIVQNQHIQCTYIGNKHEYCYLAHVLVNKQKQQNQNNEAQLSHPSISIMFLQHHQFNTLFYVNSFTLTFP